MAQAPQSFTDMFKNLGEQLKLPQVDVPKIMEHHQKNLDAMARSWQAMASGASEVASKQRAIFEEAVKDVTEMAKDYKPGGSPQEIMAKQTEFAKKAMEAAIANTRDIAELVQKSSSEAFKIVQDRMKESYDEIKASVEKKRLDRWGRATPVARLCFGERGSRHWSGAPPAKSDASRDRPGSSSPSGRTSSTGLRAAPAGRRRHTPPPDDGRARNGCRRPRCSRPEALPR